MMKKNHVEYYLFVLIVFCCHGFVYAQQPKIIEGEELDISEAPWTVLLRFENGGCGSVYIGDGWLLTAAHCVENRDFLAVYPGINNRCDLAERISKAHAISEVYIYPDFFDDEDGRCHDMAMLKIETSIDDLPNVQAIDYVPFMEGVDVTLYGWGLKEDNESTCSFFKVNIGPVSDPNPCEEGDGSCIFLGDVCMENMATLDYEGANRAGPGDSGGPAVSFVGPDRDAVLIGIMYRAGSVIKNVNFYTEWINNVKAGAIEPTNYPKPLIEELPDFGESDDISADEDDTEENHSNNQSNHEGNSNTGYIVGSVVGGVVLTAVVSGLIYWKVRRNKLKTQYSKAEVELPTAEASGEAKAIVQESGSGCE